MYDDKWTKGWNLLKTNSVLLVEQNMYSQLHLAKNLQTGKFVDNVNVCWYQNKSLLKSYQIKDSKLWLWTVDAKDEVEGSVVSVDQLVVGAPDQAEMRHDRWIRNDVRTSIRVMFCYNP